MSTTPPDRYKKNTGHNNRQVLVSALKGKNMYCSGIINTSAILIAKIDI